MVDVSQHELVPEHVVLDEDELQDVLDEYDIDRTDLPKIKRTDPALPDEAEMGNVVKIIRESRTTDTAVVYRLVVD
ncbi:DNA-directed RNA polymerase subunit H [Haloarchaeobius iranensis]|uniref:DNA-directed RNA polymerase subunit Rpo5 n=1 Tax=Haloarchaeobius iranensis TaxID=996166 RepID=A0A1G9XMX8_9EURY|nr:DNA-directed RNA polymerase subunit H [Haloarchaeobius iranensis]SDM97841.1 DNA-directed RNA polymerase, subunit H [Haloarchaeobius iranensis]